jgi:sulfur-carrier protein
MTVEVRLFAILRKYLPAGSGRTCTRMELPAGVSIADVLSQLDIPEEQATLVLVDGRHEADRQRRLGQDCVLSVFPPVAGG